VLSGINEGNPSAAKGYAASFYSGKSQQKVHPFIWFLNSKGIFEKKGLAKREIMSDIS